MSRRDAGKTRQGKLTWTPGATATIADMADMVCVSNRRRCGRARARRVVREEGGRGRLRRTRFTKKTPPLFFFEVIKANPFRKTEAEQNEDNERCIVEFNTYAASAVRVSC